MQITINNKGPFIMRAISQHTWRMSSISCIFTLVIGSFAYAMKLEEYNLTILDKEILCGTLYDWQPYLNTCSLDDIFKTLKEYKNYGSLTDSKGDNLFLAFIDFDEKVYKKYWEKAYYAQKESSITSLILPNPEPCSIAKLQQFIDAGFDLNFHNTKTGTTLLMKLLHWLYFHHEYMPVKVILWLIPLCKNKLDLQDNKGYTALSKSYFYYECAALLVKYNAQILFPKLPRNSTTCNRHYDSKKAVVALETMCCSLPPERCCIANDQARELYSTMYQYNKLLKKPFDTKALSQLIKKSNEGLAFLNHAIICNRTEVLDYFIGQAENKQKMLLNIIGHCATWNKAGAVQYALTLLDPNRTILIESTNHLKTSSNNSSSPENPYFATFLDYMTMGLSWYIMNECKEETPKEKKLQEPELSLITIYKNALKDPKTGFKAWLFIDAFDRYITYGPAKLLDFKDYQNNFNLNFLYL